MNNPWPRAKAAGYVAAVLGSLHLREPEGGAFARLSGKALRQALDYADRSGLTLFLDMEALPEEGRARVSKSLEQNRERLLRLEQVYAEVEAKLESVAMPFVFLKGLHQCALSGHDRDRRVQYDIDLLTRPERAAEAAEMLGAIGFVPFGHMEAFPTDHLPPMIRKTGWEFRGDYFDPEIPTSVEIHFRLWDEETSGLRAPGLDAFWNRRTRERGLAPLDAIGYTALHLLKHLLMGSVRPFHAYELACMLQQGARTAMWRDWVTLHGPELRRLELLGFLLAQSWFGCPLPREALADYDALPRGARVWFDRLALSPAGSANKDELWLHLSLLGSGRERRAVLRRRLLPLRPPPPIDGVYLTDGQLTLGRRVLRGVRQTRFVARRVAHHAMASVRLAGSGARWWWMNRGGN